MVIADHVETPLDTLLNFLVTFTWLPVACGPLYENEPLGGRMRRNPVWSAQAVAVTPQKGAKSIACLLFVLFMGSAFWAGAIWASLPLIR